MTILYADDDHDDRDLMSEALTKIDPTISCIIANDGRQALNILKDNTQLPDCIFLDINMPVMDGKKCLIELKKNKRFRAIPVVIYSTTTDKDEIDELYTLGASTYIQKPNNFTDLYETLNTFVKLVQN